jgi:hypothetical protein
MNVMDTVNNIVILLKDNFVNFQLSLYNPWLWISGIIVAGWLYSTWGLRKLLLFIVSLGVVVFLRFKVYAFIAGFTKSAEVDYGGMIVNSIFYISIVIVVVYFAFIKTD